MVSDDIKRRAHWRYFRYLTSEWHSMTIIELNREKSSIINRKNWREISISHLNSNAFSIFSSIYLSGVTRREIFAFSLFFIGFIEIWNRILLELQNLNFIYVNASNRKRSDINKNENFPILYSPTLLISDLNEVELFYGKSERTINVENSHQY